MPQQFDAVFREREDVLPTSAIVRLAVPRAVVDTAAPGQFVLLHLAAGGSQDPFLARPFSIMRATQDGEDSLLDLLVFTGGRGAARLADARPGERFTVVGPLGKGYQLGERARRVLLLAAGHGIAPIVALAEASLRLNLEVTMLVGAPTAGQLLPLTYLPDDAEVVVATQDGSRGHHGTVIDLVGDYLAWADAIYAYTPEGLYRELRDKLRGYRGTRPLPPVQVAMERSMACGVGVCLGCVVPTTTGLKTVCRDGPVFALTELVLD